MSKKKENKDKYDSSNLFKKPAILHPPTYNGVADLEDFKEWIWDMEKVWCSPMPKQVDSGIRRVLPQRGSWFMVGHYKGEVK